MIAIYAPALDTTTFLTKIRCDVNSIYGFYMSGQEKIAEILLESVPRELLLSFERLCPAVLERALRIGEMFDTGHRNSVTGHSRHFGLNEALSLAFDDCGIPHNPLRGNGIVVGRVDLCAIARVHMNSFKWDNSRRSKSKVKLCAPNRTVASMVQPDWIQNQNPMPIETITLFLVTQGDGSAINPCQIFLVVPDETMDLRNPIFSESLDVFVRRYQPAQDVTRTEPKLKPGVKKQPKSDES